MNVTRFTIALLSRTSFIRSLILPPITRRALGEYLIGCRLARRYWSSKRRNGPAHAVRSNWSTNEQLIPEMFSLLLSHRHRLLFKSRINLGQGLLSNRRFATASKGAVRLLRKPTNPFHEELCDSFHLGDSRERSKGSITSLSTTSYPKST